MSVARPGLGDGRDGVLRVQKEKSSRGFDFIGERARHLEVTPESQ